MSLTHAGLRAWAKGLYPLEAAVELLVRAFDGRFATPGNPWIQPCDQPGWWWLDTHELVDDNLGGVSGGERRLLLIAASLAGGAPVSLADTLPGLDRDLTDLVLAALAHANGSHEHADIRHDSERGVSVHHARLRSLHPWPGREDVSEPAPASRPVGAPPLPPPVAVVGARTQPGIQR